MSGEVVELIDKAIDAGARPSYVMIAMDEVERLARRTMAQWGPGSGVVLHIKLEAHIPEQESGGE